MQGKRVVLIGCVLTIVAGATAAAVVAGTRTSLVGRPRNSTFKEREAITGALPKSLKRVPVGCAYLQIRASSDGRYARVAVWWLNASHEPCGRYASNGPDWILRKNGSRWKVIAHTGGSSVARPRCSLGIPRYLLLAPCRG